ncbi:MAG: M1 family metallopeptidase [Clostridiales bacterium]|nr:M1 family metallopeptidase [Clostridiales bacterium]
MRKFVCTLLAATIVFPAAAAMTACGEVSERDNYRITATYSPEERKLSAEMTYTFVNRFETSLDTLKFELYANAYREGAQYQPVSQLYHPAAYYKGNSYGGIEIGSVSGGAFEICGEDENILSVKLDKEVYPNEETQLTISFSTTLAEINHRLGVGENAINLSGFYPVLCHYTSAGFQEYVYSCNGDPFVTACADYEVSLTVPENLSAVCAGEAEEVAENGNKTYHVIAENVRDIAFVLGEKFKSATTDAAGVQVEYCYFADETPEETLAVASQSLNFYSRSFGQYPYARYVVVETDFPYGGMEYPTLSMISSKLQGEDRMIVVAHETAHQWWYGVVGNNQFENGWQDEGLADYSTAMFFNASSFGFTGDDLLQGSEKAYRDFFSVYSQLHGTANTVMTRPLTSFASEYEYVNIAYGKGMIMFDRLKTSLGEKKFLTGLKRYYDAYAYKIASPEDLSSCFGGGGAAALMRSFTDGLCVI